MKNKGYNYKITPTDNSFEPLYVKTIQDVCRVLRELYPEKTFIIAKTE